MTTLEAPTVTPCPVPWCPDAGHHAWDTHPSGEFSRLHEVKTRIGVSDTRTVTVVAVVYEDEVTDAPLPSVEFITGHLADAVELRTPGAVGSVVDALQDAANMVFGREPVGGVDQSEFDAALYEVIERARTPADVNRLVAAAIRLRKAAMPLD